MQTVHLSRTEIRIILRGLRFLEDHGVRLKPLEHEALDAAVFKMEDAFYEEEDRC